MISKALLERIENAKRDLNTVANGPRLGGLRGDIETSRSFDSARDLALRWLARVEPVMLRLDDSSLQSLVWFVERISSVIDRGDIKPGETFRIVLSRVTAEFTLSLPSLIYELLEASGLAGLSDEDFPGKRIQALHEIESASSEANANLRKSADDSVHEFEAALKEALVTVRKTADEAAKDLELAKANARHISVESAQKQFNEAAKRLIASAAIWSSISLLLFVGLVSLLVWFTRNPPPLISQIVNSFNPVSGKSPIPVSIPLLIAASAYFTSIRLALVGVIGVGLAFSLRMTRAYFHMIEHNKHKLRVTNSIEAFVAAVRTDEQKDLVLGKLVESVTSFGDSGILSNQTEGSGGFPSVVFDSITKNVSKSQ